MLRYTFLFAVVNIRFNHGPFCLFFSRTVELMKYSGSTRLRSTSYVSQVTLPNVAVNLADFDTGVSATQAIIDSFLEEGKQFALLWHSVGDFVAANSVRTHDIAFSSADGLESGDLFSLLTLPH